MIIAELFMISIHFDLQRLCKPDPYIISRLLLEFQLYWYTFIIFENLAFYATIREGAWPSIFTVYPTYSMEHHDLIQNRFLNRN